MSKGRKAIHPPASGSCVPFEGLLKRDLELAAAHFAAACKRRQPCEPASCSHAGRASEVW